jgi:WD40 repeat protein
MTTRFLITLGSPDCLGLGLQTLKNVSGDVEAISQLLRADSQAYSHALTAELPLGVSSTQIKNALGNWFLDATRTENDCVVIYVAGHGDNLGQFGSHCLLTSDTKPRAVYTAVRTNDLVDLIFAAARYPRSVMLILDVCFAGKGAGDVVAEVGRNLKKGFPSGAGFWVIATTDRNTEAYDGAFVRAWQALMNDKTGAWLSPGGKPFLHPGDFVVAVNEYLGLTNSQQRVIPFCVGGPDEPKFIKNPWYSPSLDGTTVDLVTHWDPKARGDDKIGGIRSYFAGRSEVLAVCRAWLRAETSDGTARVVTGLPGSGKSAVLGQLVLNPGEFAPPLAKVHARGQQTEEVAATIARQLACRESAPDSLIVELSSLSAPVGIIVDSLDEAANPAQLERDFLIRLGACAMVRLIVGMRTRSGSSDGINGWRELNLDKVEFFKSTDVEAYSFALLTKDEKRAVFAPSTASQLAEFVTERAGKSFLYARLATRWLSETGSVDTSKPNWRAELRLPGSIEAIFGADLDRFDRETRNRFIDLLVPLAYARRRGMPQKNLWARVASRIADRPYVNADIRDLKDRAGFYLVQDTENGETVYRLFHQSFADYLKNLTRDADVETRFAAALDDFIIESGGWSAIREPYLLASYPSHAAAAGCLNKVLADAAFLVNVHPNALLPHLHEITSEKVWGLAQAYRESSNWFATGKHREGVRYLELTALKYNSRSLSKRLAELYASTSSWWPQWAKWSSTLAGWVAFETNAHIGAICVSSTSEGNLLAICGHQDGSVTVWRLHDRVRLLEYRPPGPEAWVRSLTVSANRGNEIVVGTWQNGAVRAFSIATGETTGQWAWTEANSGDHLTNVVAFNYRGMPLVAVAGDTELFLFELPTLAIRSHRPDATKSSIYSLAVTFWNDNTVIAAGGDTVAPGGEALEAYPLKLWDIPTLECVTNGGEDASIASELLPFEIEGTPFLLTKAFTQVMVRRISDLVPVQVVRTFATYVATYPAKDHTVIFWTAGGQIWGSKAWMVPAEDNEPRTLGLNLTPIGPKVDAPDQIWSDIVILSGRPSLLSAQGNYVRVWDVAELLRPAGLLTEPPAASLNIRSVVAWGDTVFTGAYDGTVEACNGGGSLIWSRKLTTSVSCMAVAAASSELLVGCADGKIRRLHAASGEEAATSLTAGSAVYVLKVQKAEEGERVFAAVGVNESLYFARAWFLATGEEMTTWKSHIGPEALSNFGEVDDHRYTVNGFNPALALTGYYRTKWLTAMTVLEFEGRSIVSLAGPHGEVGQIDADALQTVGKWIGGESGDSINCLDGGVFDGKPYVFGGNDKGRLFRGGICAGTLQENIIRLPKAHRGSISALTNCKTPFGWVLASGGEDGAVRLWTLELDFLFQINAGRHVTSLAWFGDYLAVGTDRGMLCVMIRWDQVF